MGECQTVLGQLAETEVSRGSLFKVPAVHLEAEKLEMRVLGVKEVMFEWFSFAQGMSVNRVMRRIPTPPLSSLHVMLRTSAEY